MQPIHTAAQLTAAIEQLQQKRQAQGQQLKQQLNTTLDSLRPVNLIKNTLRDITNSDEIKENLLKTTLGLAVGMFSKRIIVGSSKGLLRKALGMAVELGMADAIIKNADSIKSLGQKAISALFTRRTPND